MDLTACQPTWVMLCRNELCQKLEKIRQYYNTGWLVVFNVPSTARSFRDNIILFVEATIIMMKFKVCKGDLTNSYVLI